MSDNDIECPYTETWVDPEYDCPYCRFWRHRSCKYAAFLVASRIMEEA